MRTAFRTVPHAVLATLVLAMALYGQWKYEFDYRIQSILSITHVLEDGSLSYKTGSYDSNSYMGSDTLGAVYNVWGGQAAYQQSTGGAAYVGY